ncbi:hypothetical protein L1887_30954 [Cichorium endivia]|nr:hypothetical protein L1887_30954 [Cichorium endivia]
MLPKRLELASVKLKLNSFTKNLSLEQLHRRLVLYIRDPPPIISTCVSIPVLNSHLHWNYNTNGTVDLAFRHTGATNSQWVAWALNLGRPGMLGSQALVAVTSSNGSIQAYTSAVTDYGTNLPPSPLSFEVPRITAESAGGEVVIYATIVLPSGGTGFNF